MLDTEAKGTVAAPVLVPVAVAVKASAVSVGAPASPAAAKIAAEQNVNTADIAGTGRGGRVTKEDVVNQGTGSQAAVSPAKAGTQVGKPITPPVQLPAGDRTEQRVPMSRLRQRVAGRLQSPPMLD